MVSDLTDSVGLDSDCLISPKFARDRNWGIVATEDFPFHAELELLISRSRQNKGQIKGVYFTPLGPVVVDIPSAPHDLKMFVIETGSDVAVFDLPNTFVLTILCGEVTILSTDRAMLRSVFGQEDMTLADWSALTSDFFPALREKLWSSYVEGR